MYSLPFMSLAFFFSSSLMFNLFTYYI
jgi:hypothetical protein